MAMPCVRAYGKAVRQRMDAIYPLPQPMDAAPVHVQQHLLQCSEHAAHMPLTVFLRDDALVLTCAC
jgi:hypothetical protein